MQTPMPILDSKDMFSRALGHVLEKLRVRSALNPALWFCGIISAPALTISLVKYDNGTPVWLKVIIFGPVCLVTIGFLFLLLFDRDKLQSESFQIQKMSIVEERGGRRLTGTMTGDFLEDNRQDIDS